MATQNSWYDNKWFLRIISLFFALMLFVGIRGSNRATSSNTMTNSASLETTETISNVPVQLGKHDADIFVSQLQETVSVTLTGPRNIVTSLASSDLVVTTEDLTGVSTGSRTVRLEMANLPEGVKYQINPSRVVVQISRKKTITMPIEYEVAQGAIANGSEVGGVTLSTAEVELNGTEETIDRVARVYIKIATTTPQSKSFAGKYKLQIVDKDGKLLDVNASPSEIEAKVAVKAPDSQLVDLTVSGTGEDSKYSYQYHLSEGTQATVQGNSAVISRLKSLHVTVDVTGIRNSTTVMGQVEVPEDVTLLSNAQVQVAVTVIPKNDSSSQSSSNSVNATSNETSSSESRANNAAVTSENTTSSQSE